MKKTINIIIALTISLVLLTSFIKERNVLYLYINSNDEIEINKKKVKIEELKDMVKKFIMNPYNENDNSDQHLTEVEYFGKVVISKAVISIQCERNTTYNFYIKVQNEVEKAYSELRNELSISRFNRKYEALSKSEMIAVDKCIPKIISEAEPKYIWKNGKLIENYSTREK